MKPASSRVPPTSSLANTPDARPRAEVPIRRAALTTLWVVVSGITAIAATLLDAALLQRKWAYLTGGFLAADHLESVAEFTAFTLGSLLSDFAVASLLAAVTFWLSLRLRLRIPLMLALTLSASFLSVLVADFINYSLLSYLGDAVDFGLMFEMPGRSLAELFAVSSQHLNRLLWLGGGLAAILLSLGWIALRRWQREPFRLALIDTTASLRTIGVMSCVLAAIAAAVVGALRMSSDVLDNGLKRKPSAQLLGIGLARLSDLDGDGYGLLDRISDPKPFDAKIFPYALDIPGNGIDEDSLGGDLPVSDGYREAPLPTAKWAIQPNVMIVMLESVRADAIGSTLNGAPVTPILDGVATAGVTASHAYSHNGFTIQSRRHLFTGSVADIRQPSTLIDDFKANGYEVAYFSGQDESFGGPEASIGFDRTDVAYDARSDINRRYSASTTPGSLAVPFGVVIERVEAFFATRRTGRPLFLYVNLHDTHFPYHHRDIVPILAAPVVSQGDIGPERAADVRAMYLNALANVDRAVGSLLRLATAALGSRPGVVVLSDHGESLFDEGFLGHGFDMTDAQTRIPLLVSDLPLRIEEPFGEADLRDAIAKGFSSATSGGGPSVNEDPDREVFQYIGTIDSPAQIGIRSLKHRLSYDFRSRRVRIDAGRWIHPDALSSSDAVTFLRLVRTWERMRLARVSLATGSPPVGARTSRDRTD